MQLDETTEQFRVLANLLMYAQTREIQDSKEVYCCMMTAKQVEMVMFVVYVGTARGNLTFRKSLHSDKEHGAIQGHEREPPTGQYHNK